MTEAVNGEFCHANFAGRSWDSLDEDDLEAYWYSCHYYLRDEARAALFPALVYHSLTDDNAMFECLLSLDSLMTHGGIDEVKARLNGAQAAVLDNFFRYARSRSPWMQSYEELRDFLIL